jgi:hypothetical protein
MLSARARSTPLLICIGLVTLACTSTEPAGGQSLRLLFIGNSYTYYNGLPELVKALGDSAGMRGLEVESVTFGGVSLQDHWQEGTARARLANEHWDIVVLQQGPSSLPESRDLLLDYATRFSQEIRQAGGRPAFYSVWPEQSRPQDFDGARDSYTIAADSLHGMLFPASEAWRAAWRRDGSLVLYGPDGLHPTRLGTYLVGLVVVGTLTGRTPVGLPARIEVGGPAGYTLDVPAATAQRLQLAAGEAIDAFGRR